MKLLTVARDLRRRKARERRGLFVAEGVRAVEELLRSPLAIHGILTAPQLAETSRGQTLLSAIRERTIPHLEVNEADFDSAAETESPQGVLAIGVVPDRRMRDVPDVSPVRVLALDAVQDPGNVGTIIRTAAALGAAATIGLPGTVDLWNAKVVRSAMGTHFHHVAVTATWDELDAFRHERGAGLWAADASGSGEPLDRVARPPRLILVVGNEGSGITPSARERADRLVTLPIAASVESLNVAVAAAIFLYELNR